MKCDDCQVAELSIIDKAKLFCGLKKEVKQNRARAKFFIMFVLFAEFSQMLLFLKILVSL